MPARERVYCFLRAVRQFSLFRNRDVRRSVEALASQGESARPQTVRDAYGLIEAHLRSEELRAAPCPFAPGPPAGLSSRGDVPIGYLFRTTPQGFGKTRELYSISCDAVFTSIFVCGTTGAGKSSLVATMLVRMLPALRAKYRSAGMFFFECAKREAHRLHPALLKFGIETQVVDWRELKFNPLQAPSCVDPTTHAQSIACAFEDAWELGLPGRHIVRNAVLSLYQRFNVGSGPSVIWPDMFDLRDEVAGANAHTATKTALLSRLDDFLHILGRQCVGYARAYTPDMLEEHCTVFEMDGLTPGYQAIPLLYFAQGAYDRRVASGHDFTPLVVAIEEARNLLGGSEGPDGPRPLHRLPEVGRAVREGFVFINHTGDVAASLVNATNLQLVGLMRGPEQAQALRDIGCTNAQVQWTVQHLGKYQWIAAGGAVENWRAPVLLESLPFDIDPDKRPAKFPNSVLNSITVVTSAEARKLTVQAREPEEAGERKSVPTAPEPPGVSKAALQYLSECASLPDRTLGQHNEALGMSDVAGSKLVAELTTAGLAILHEVLAGHREHYRLVEVLDAALPLFSVEAKESLLRARGKATYGGCVHNHVIRRLAAFYRSRGATAHIERSFPIGGKPVLVDLVVEWPDGRSEAIEVEQTTDGDDSVRKCSQLGFSRICLVVPTQQRAGRILKNIQGLKAPCPVEVKTCKELGLAAVPQFDAKGQLVG